VDAARAHDPRVIVEAHAEGREVECSVIGNSEPETSLPGEISTRGAEWYDYEAKYSEGGMELAVPAPIGDEAVARVREPEWQTDPSGVRRRLEELGLPLFVKPARLGSSVGIAKVSEAAQLGAALEGAFAHDPLVIVEAFSAGTEVECAVMGLYEAEASVPGEVVLLKGAEWYDYEAKYSDGGVELRVPAGIPDAAAQQVRRLAVETFLRVGCAGLARVDFFVEDGRVLVNELNTLPGMTPTSAFPKLWEATGVPWPEACDRLVGLALERHRAERSGHAF